VTIDLRSVVCGGGQRRIAGIKASRRYGVSVFAYVAVR
jgi:hypothetical protein